MKTFALIGVWLAIFLASGCTDREAEVRKAKEAADAKARAEAARKEMETLPKAFQTPDYFKKKDPTKKPAPSPTERRKTTLS